MVFCKNTIVPENQQKGGHMKEEGSTKNIPLIGVWTLISFEVRREGEELSFPFGRDAKGLLIYTDVGRFSVQLMRSKRPNFLSGDQLKGTIKEINECFKGCISYFGRYEYDANGGFVLHHIEGSLFPNWEGTQKRFVEVFDKRVTVTTPPLIWGGKGLAVGALVWERL
jgi:hypothetical protein